MEDGGEGMRELNFGTSELVEGFIEDQRHNDMGLVANTIELAFTTDDEDDAPVAGWTLRDTASLFNQYTVYAGRVHPADVKGIFKLWGHWVNGPEEVYILIGKFRVV